MDELLPSYESAMQRDPWLLVGPYLPSIDLCSAALVCRRWHHIFSPHLWGSPASHFGVQNDTVYVALTRFKRTLPYVRDSVRDLTHTLRFPPAHAEIYEGPHAEWLRDCLEYLPRLQCLIVDGLPFFDHSCLLSLRYSSLRWKSARPNAFPVFSLRLLDASACTNATSIGLAEALPHFPDLVSLNLSRTAAARDKAVFSAFKSLRNLRVLNLRGLGLRDVDFQTIAETIRSRVRSLDISDNTLTDASARLLVDRCLKETVIRAHTSRGPLAPVDSGYPDSEMYASEMEDIVGHLRKTLTRGFVGSLAIEEARDVGITHLYLSRNSITVQGVSGLLRSKRLQVCDMGVLPAVMQSSTSSGDAADDIQSPSISKLTPILCEYASPKLRYLRINYRIVTEDAPVEAATPLRAELGGNIGRYFPSNAHELEATEPPTPELDSESTAVVELPGNSSYPVELPDSSPPQLSKLPSLNGNDARDCGWDAIQSPVIKVTAYPSKIRRSSADAPEPVIVDSPMRPVTALNRNDENYSPGSSRETRDQHVCLSPITLTSNRQIFNLQAAVPAPRSRAQSFYYIEDRRARLDFRQNGENRLHPGMLSKLHTLVLTDVPTTTTDKEVIRRLTQYIKDAAEEAFIARQRARHTYMLPPGRSRLIAEQEYAHALFALRRIVLEMAPPQAAPKKISASWRAYPTKSSTGDADSESFWEAATQDFSFFDDEECGQPGYELGRTLPLTAISGLELASSHTTPPPQPIETRPDPKPLLDVVGEIGKFRRERKAAYNNLVELGEADPVVEGHWPGDVTIFRQSANTEVGELDCFGNRYESGWYYR